VPEIAPVDVFIARLAGRPVAAQEYGATPPTPATVNEYGAPANPPGNAAVAIDRPEPIVKVKSFAADCGVGAVESVKTT
jgi:hypothetical protein